MHKLFSAAVVGFIGFIFWIIYQANTGGQSIFFDLVKNTRDGDKIGHFALFGVLTLGCNIALRYRVLRWRFLGVYWGTVLVSIFVVLEELSQGFIPRRTLDARDLYADGIGILAFTLLTFIIHLIVKLNHKSAPPPTEPK